MANGASLIKTYYLVKCYHDTVDIKNVTFNVQADEVFSFLDSNGAGNITLSPMIAGLEKPDRAPHATAKPSSWSMPSRCARWMVGRTSGRRSTAARKNCPSMRV
jgi:ABC-type Na+ transport system ATPase subunit NatA